MDIVKPIVFFSHSSRDQTPLRLLKQRFMDLTGATMDVFLSSDGQSIRLGSNWVASVEGALGAAKLMFVFISPNSIHSPWLYFEAGHAFSKGIAVVPVGLFGVDIGHLPSPMNLLQGFNLINGDSMNNIIATANDTFRVRHQLGFSQADFDALDASGFSPTARRLLGDHAALMARVRFVLSDKLDALDDLAAHLKDVHGFVRCEPGIVISGAQIGDLGSYSELIAELDPVGAGNALEPLESGLCAVAGRSESTACPYFCEIMFSEEVWYEWELYRQLARLGTEVAVTEGVDAQLSTVWMRWRSLDFTLGNSMARHSHVFLTARTSDDTFRDTGLGELVNLLFDRGVLKYRHL